MFPAFHFLGSSRLSQNCGDVGGRIQLAESSFVAVVWLVLRNEDKIRFRDFGKVIDACRGGVKGCSELRVPDLRGARKPGI